MSKERELLKELEWKIEAYMESNYWPNIHLDLDKIKEVLAEESETKMTWYQNGYEQAKKDLKQQPLSDEEIQNIVKSTDILYVATGDGDYGSNDEAIVPFVRAIEKAHNIGE